MASGDHNQEMLPQNFKRQLALAVRSIQWSYAIFWSISDRQPGLLEWGDGYYNGDIKTRKTVQSIDLNPGQLSLQRSEQLKELYESLSASEASPQARRPSAALSPEDLTDTEWYFLVCMSFVFNVGQGMPGRTFANGLPIWLCNAQYADSKIFSRSLLAKSASIQTVVCFPFARGVVELGVTELVPEDQGLIQHIKTSFLETPCPVVSKKSSSGSDRELACATFDQEIFDTGLNLVEECEDLDINSPKNSSNNQLAEDSFMVEGINGKASPVQSWQLIDDDLSNFVPHSLNSSECISQTIVDPVKVTPLPHNKANDNGVQDVQDYNHRKLTALDLQTDDLHYKSVLSSLLKTSHPLFLGAHSQNCHQQSTFVCCNRIRLEHSLKLKGGTPQRILKKILFEVPRMYDGALLQFPEDNSNKLGILRPVADEIGASHVLSERKRREKIHERFMILKSIVPSITRVDKVSILDDTIEYIQELERRVEELGACREQLESEARTKRKPQDTAERTSDNYGSKKIGIGKKPFLNKRKACDIDETDAVSNDGLGENLIVITRDKEVLVEITCPWREGLLLEIVDAISHLHLDSHSVQSSTVDGILSLTIKSKHNGLSAASVGAIKQGLRRVAWKR